jgi:hypothetical protein
VLGRFRAIRADDDPALPGTQLAWQLPEGVHARTGYGVRAGDRYAVFGIGPGDPRGGDAEIGVTEQARYGVLDLHTGEVTVHPAVDHGRTADAAAPVSGSDGRPWVVRTEAGPRPPAECPTTPAYCWTWTLHATELPGGASTPIAAATVPGPQLFLPQVATDLHTVAWLDMSASGDGSAALAIWQPGGVRRVVARGLPVGRLSLDGAAAWIGTDDGNGNGPRLLKIDLSTGRTTPVPLPAAAGEAVVAGGRVAAIRRPADNAPSGVPTMVDVAPVATPVSTRTMFSGSDVYTLNWAPAGQVIVSCPAGYLIADGMSTRPLRIDVLSGVHHDAGRLAMVQRRADHQVVIVAR